MPQPDIWTIILLLLTDVRTYAMSIIIGMAAYLHRITIKNIKPTFTGFLGHVLVAASSAYIAGKFLSYFGITGDLHTALVGVATWSGDHAFVLAEKVISRHVKKYVGDLATPEICDECKNKEEKDN
jgi:hypothetical protein